MKAILIHTGAKLNIYALVRDNDSCEVLEFFEECESDKKKKALGAGMLVLVERLADEGYFLKENLSKCWKIKEEQFCELRKGKARISYFKYPPGRILLVSCFSKSKPSEDSEYERALRLNNRFYPQPMWEE